MHPPRNNLGELEREIAALGAAKRRAAARALAAVVALAAAATAWQVCGERVRAFVRGEIDLEGEPRYEPEYPPDPRTLSAIDFRHVHARLVPAWTIALANATTPYWERRADDAFAELMVEVAPDPNLLALLSTAHRDLRDDPIRHARRLDYHLWAYNDYLDRNGIPWRLEAALVLGEERAIFHTMSYEVLFDATSGAGHRLRLLRRADRTTTREGWLGHTGRSAEGAMVLMRRVLHFAVRHVWPGLHPALDGRRPPNERPWLGHVRDEVRAAVGERTFRLLSETAEDQQALIEVAASIEARHACGSRFRVSRLPYNGLSPRSIAALRSALARSRDDVECPEVTLAEAARIVGASERLGNTDGLAEALERLAMVVARSVATHELRHVADGPELSCPGCPEGLTGTARDEVSAYLAAMAAPGLGYLALFQACAMPPSPGAHGAARAAVLDALLPYGCDGPTGHGLYEVASGIERALFGDRPAVELPEALPSHVRLLPRRRSARASAE